MKQELEILEAKFRRFLNDTIIGASKDYYAKQKRYELRELQIVDDESYEGYLCKYATQDLFEQFDDCFSYYELTMFFETLSSVERAVLFLHFEEKYKLKEIAKILNMRNETITRIKKRALKKIKNYMKGLERYE